MNRSWLIALSLTVFASACGTGGLLIWEHKGPGGSGGAGGSGAASTGGAGGQGGILETGTATSPFPSTGGGSDTTDTQSTSKSTMDAGGSQSGAAGQGGEAGGTTSSSTGGTTTTTTNTNTGTMCVCDCPLGPPDWPMISQFCLDPVHQCIPGGKCPPCCQGPGIPNPDQDAGAMTLTGRCINYECVNLQP